MAQKSFLPILAFIAVLIQFLVTAWSLPNGMYRFQYTFIGGGASYLHLLDPSTAERYSSRPYVGACDNKSSCDWKILNQPGGTIRLLRADKQIFRRRDVPSGIHGDLIKRQQGNLEAK